MTLTNFHQRFPGFVAFLTLPALLIGGVALSPRCAYADNEPMEPLPVALAASQPSAAAAGGGYVGA